MAAPQHEAFPVLMARVRTSSEGAARALIEEYGDLILRVVRQKLHKQLRPKFDSLDFVQAVWASFFALPADRLAFDQPEQLAGFLARLAGNKVIESVRQRMGTLKYNVNREQALHDKENQVLPIPSREPRPEEIVIAREEWQRLLREHPAHHQEIIMSLSEGNSPREVALNLGFSEKTIRRVIRKLRPGKAR
jgi:RNA polymerase sigma-70 factor (ECF subfamily)